MMSGGSSRKSGRSDDYYDENTPNKKPKQGPEFKTQLCARFSQGFCPDGACCHFAHGDQELRKSSQILDSAIRGLTSIEALLVINFQIRNQKRSFLLKSRNIQISSGVSETEMKKEITNLQWLCVGLSIASEIGIALVTMNFLLHKCR
ncbi:hypothetical protein POM88_046937 [Heracleum sosnowskyi]|uniref:C3H1-type domain-containing protein n=1 Tax=Heracleum sosnowskyi TaxID=360622 RepID=A0AAD8M804_9APIA|nr:hypothetical protein POM88_046937 [Heracleum sosnowskyi]